MEQVTSSYKNYNSVVLGMTREFLFELFQYENSCRPISMAF